MLDIHSHIIPNIDDGSKNIDMSMEMIKIAADDGIDNIIATPHYCTGCYEKNYEYIEGYVEYLNKLAKEHELNIKILPGQEIFIDNYTLDYLKQGIIGSLNESKYMLVEFNMAEFDESIMDILYELRIIGIEPIIAHPERYIYIVENPLFINKFVEEQYHFQINSGSITGLFGKKVEKTAEILIQHGICSFVASDAHSNNRRVPKISEALNIVNQKNNASYEIILNNYKAFLNNGSLYFSGEKIKEKRKIFWVW
ncbi:CpsB/CapC family capsule biosynthesis tyrosine phosphatase [Clostridium sp. JN-9]|uniref:tyrosine-protein phosphatase n=1 Tax=Clostridium sp. JN-9 TaxID=2507159 RepID=UPI000FFDFFE3|nr:CpsB/CapC family capsule biosynthesis tyrosine phosphatase [Clostridium sp. JN-9]QAT40498.1 exopolysaccharide biosynthesis protein [Clostridium sp. JN-9]